jgi:hypothetical protein
VLAARERREQLRQAKAEIIADLKAKLKLGGRPRPRSLILGI